MSIGSEQLESISPATNQITKTAAAKKSSTSKRKKSNVASSEEEEDGDEDEEEEVGDLEFDDSEQVNGKAGKKSQRG